MIALPIDELSIVGIFERGTPNSERIVLRANKSVNMGAFALLLGVRGEPGWATPIPDNFFWFGDGQVNEGEYIFVYTGPGDARASELPTVSTRVYSLHWGRKQTVLHMHEVVPILIRIDAVAVGTDPPPPLLQTAPAVAKRPPY